MVTILLVNACKPVDYGMDTAGSSSSGSTAGSSSSGGTASPTGEIDTAGSSSSGGTASPTGGMTGAGIGAPCDHGGDLDFAHGPHLSRDEADCAGGFCAFGNSSNAPEDPSTSDQDCNAPLEPGDQRFTCDGGTCILADAYKMARSMCAAPCEADDDCALADPMSACVNGFACVIVTPSCCEKLCLCEDDLSAGTIEAAKGECAQIPAPGCDL